MVIFYQYKIIQAKTMCTTTTECHCAFIEEAPLGFASRAEKDGPWDFFNKVFCVCGNARHALQEVEHRSFHFQYSLYMSSERQNNIFVQDVVSIFFQKIYLNIKTVQKVFDFLKSRYHTILLCNHVCCYFWIGIENCSGR